jgi:ribose transport system permease protein
MREVSETAMARGPKEGRASMTEVSENRSTTWARGRQARLARVLSVRNIGAVYVWLLIVILFSIISPDAFPTAETGKAVLNQYAITGMVALSVIVPLAAGVYDLSIGAIVGLAGVLVAYLLEKTSMSPLEAGLIVMVVCVLIGLCNAFVVTALKVNSFIATLGTGAIITAITSALSGDEVITGRVGGSFSRLATTSSSGIQIPVIYLLVIMLALGYWLERTQSGRQIYATGFDGETARLTGAPVTRIVTLSFITSAAVSGFAGMVLAAQVASGSPDVGASYLIPAFSAAFLGATQIRGGRFNPWGTVMGVMLLGTGNVGLLVAGGPTWTPDLFEGCVLIAAVALSVNRAPGVSRARWRLRRRASGGAEVAAD